MGGRRVGRLRSAALKFALAAAPLLCLAQEPSFRVDVRLVRVLATVKDAGGQPAGNLTKDDFAVYDNGVRQQIAVLERHTAQPLSIALLVDTSGSTAKELRYEVDSVTRFLHALFGEGNPEDAAALYSFNWEIRLHASYSRRLQRFERALKEMKAEGGTSLYDALYLASGDLEIREGRHAVVVVTDGGDTTSTKNYHNALEAVQRADAVLYPILVMPVTNEAGRNIGGENALAGLAAGTGGRVFLPSGSAELDTAFAEILRELRTQYLIGYYPKDVPPGDRPFHSLHVEVKRPGLRVSARSGYYEH